VNFLPLEHSDRMRVVGDKVYSIAKTNSILVLPI
jgi:hypothetical protein